MDLSFKLANNSKLTSNKHKKYFKINLYLYCSVENYKLALLLSFILLSYIIASNREITNISLFYYMLVMSNLIEVNAISEDININKLRGKSLLLSPNISRKMLNYLDILSISYVDKMEAQNNDLSWFNQTKQENF